MTSATPNMPMASAAKLMPSARAGMPSVKRCWPELTSVPTSPSSRPTITIAMALRSEPRASTTAPTSPNTINEK